MSFIFISEIFDVSFYVPVSVFSLDFNICKVNFDIVSAHAEEMFIVPASLSQS